MLVHGSDIGDQRVDVFELAEGDQGTLANLGVVDAEDHLLGRGQHDPFNAGLQGAADGEAVLDADAAGGDEGLVHLHPAQEAFGVGTDQGEGAGRQHTAGDDHRDTVDIGKLGGHIDVVGHHRQPAPLPQGAGHLGGGGAAVQEHGLAVGHHRGGGAADALLLLYLAGVADLGRGLRGDALPHGAAVGPPQQALGLQPLEIAPDGHLRDLQVAGEVGHAHRARLLNL